MNKCIEGSHKQNPELFTENYYKALFPSFVHYHHKKVNTCLNTCLKALNELSDMDSYGLIYYGVIWIDRERPSEKKRSLNKCAKRIKKL